MKNLLNTIGSILLAGMGAATSVACSHASPTKKINQDYDSKIIKEYINNTTLDNIKNSEINVISYEAEKKYIELFKIKNKYKNEFKTNHKNIDFQLFILFFLRKEEANFKWMGVQFEKKIPPEKNDVRIHLYEIIQQIKKEVFVFEKKEYKINHLIVELANELEKKYYY